MTSPFHLVKTDTTGIFLFFRTVQPVVIFNLVCIKVCGSYFLSFFLLPPVFLSGVGFNALAIAVAASFSAHFSAKQSNSKYNSKVN